MPRRAWIALAAYALMMATLATSIYDPFQTGDDDSWVGIVLLVGAHLGLGLAVARWWALIAPAVSGVVAYGVAEDAFTAVVSLLLFLTLGPTVVGAGWGAARLLRARATPVAIAMFGLAALVVAVAVAEAIQRSRAPHVPPAVEAQLPTDGDMCGPGRRTRQRRTDALVRELRRDPEALVPYTFYLSEGFQETRDITVREMAEEQIRNGACNPATRRRLEAALGV